MAFRETGDAVSVMELSGDEVKVPVSQVVAQCWTDKTFYMSKPGQQQNTAALPGEDGMLLMFSVHQVENKMSSLDQRICPECQEPDEFALAGRPLRNSTCSWSHRFWQFTADKDLLVSCTGQAELW